MVLSLRHSVHIYIGNRKKGPGRPTQRIDDLSSSDDLRLTSVRALAEMLRQIEPLPREDIPEFLAGKSKNRYLGALLQYRYLALAVLLNVPGNFVIGGGGGIALMAGISRLYSLPGILIAVAIAVAPVPLAVTIFGAQILSG